MEDAIGMRKSAKALENSFFAKENQKLRARLQEEAARKRRRELLAEALNLDDDNILDHLMDLDLSPEAIVAFNLCRWWRSPGRTGRCNPRSGMPSCGRPRSAG